MLQPEKEITLQYNVPQAGLGAALLQNGQPVANASSTLTEAETRSAQIKKELLHGHSVWLLTFKATFMDKILFM